ncbi:peptide ABC transporter permease [Brevibacillus sp. SKDU10]|uniref:ABC transporter permease n=1 Tax=Brevibacillus sp. SKDU10 TaxID=1247872 RepID=UPI0007C964E1|nr:ABC transporter permease [Brevibacillus sp. SKDU10]OAJ74357.1 peptide ABC transporter permease [Brevibacillus sp. SKDU10]
MNLIESFRIAIDGIWSNKLRSILTMLGIIIGIASVIAIMTMGKGGKSMMTSQFGNVTDAKFTAMVSWETEEAVKDDDLTIDDAVTLERINPYIKNVMAQIYGGGTIKDKKKDISAQIYGTTGNFLEVNSSYKMEKGRFYTRDDDKEQRDVVVLDKGLADKLFPQGNAVGNRIYMSDASFVVIGVLKNDMQGFMGGGMQDLVYMPARTYLNHNEKATVNMFHIQAKSNATIQAGMDFTKQYLNRVHKHKDHYMVKNSADDLKEITKMLDMLTMVFSVIAGISLLVGGIGVMNIMLVSVTERTREIGIRKALGAKKRDILTQFLIESIIVCLIGGGVGVALGLGLASIIISFAGMPPVTSWESILIAFGFSSAIGIFFGIYPANKAAKLDPIEALRYE